MKEEYSVKADAELEELKELVASAKFKAVQIISDAEIDLKHQMAGYKYREIRKIVDSE
jgi:hypothetical protein